MKENIPSLPCHFVSEQGQVFRYKRRHPEILLRELSTKFKMPLSVISKIIKGIDPITKPYL